MRDLLMLLEAARVFIEEAEDSDHDLSEVIQKMEEVIEDLEDLMERLDR